jgi:predicted transcriptional regulator
MDNDLLSLTSHIVSAHVSNNTRGPAVLISVYSALAKTSEPAAVEAPKAEPAVSIRSSVKHDYIVGLEDGAKLKMLKRHLMTNFQMTPEDYRARWGFPRDYPMVAPAYAKQRRELAQKIGLGRKKADALAPAVKTAKKSGKTETAVATPSPRSAADRQKRSHPWQNRLKRDPGEPAHALALISDWRGRHRVK